MKVVQAQTAFLLPFNLFQEGDIDLHFLFTFFFIRKKKAPFARPNVKILIFL